MNSYGSFDAMAAGTGALTGGGAMGVFNIEGGDPEYNKGLVETIGKNAEFISRLMGAVPSVVNGMPQMEAANLNGELRAFRDKIEGWIGTPR